MDKRKQLLATLSLLAIGAGSQVTPASANIFDRCDNLTGLTEAECACQAALDEGTTNALKSFLRLYAKNADETACGALASTGPTAEDSDGEVVDIPITQVKPPLPY
jgi:hypothetical protein